MAGPSHLSDHDISRTGRQYPTAEASILRLKAIRQLVRPYAMVKAAMMK